MATRVFLLFAMTILVGAGPAPSPSVMGHDWLLLGGDLYDFDGEVAKRPALVIFFAPDCATCVAELQAINDFVYRHAEVLVIGIDAGNHDVATWDDFIARHDPQFRITRDPQGALARAFGLDTPSLPALFVVERFGGNTRQVDSPAQAEEWFD